MRQFRSLLIERAKLHVWGLQVLGFAVHRHLPEHGSVAVHRHGWSQAIVYLKGAGEQSIGRMRARIEAGSLVLLPPRVPHAFTRRSQRPPLCIMINFRLRGAPAHRAVVRTLSRSELTALRQHVASLLRLQAGAGDALHWEAAVPVLQALSTVLRAGGWIRRTQSWGERPNPVVGAVLSRASEADSLADTIRRSGYHRDHLNRLVKKETGLTLGQYRAQQRLARAKQLLVGGVRVSDVCGSVGVPDQSYFARWFRRQTGQTPTGWARDQR